MSKPIITLQKPLSRYDPKPEVWNIINTHKKYLVYYPELISSRIISHNYTKHGHKFETINSIYICDWAPTYKIVSKEILNEIRNSI